jgi:hypothetical protein
LFTLWLSGDAPVSFWTRRAKKLGVRERMRHRAEMHFVQHDTTGALLYATARAEMV